MLNFEQRYPVNLQFRGMIQPLLVNVPSRVLIYLDRYAVRGMGEDGAIIYQQLDSSRLGAHSAGCLNA